MKEIIEQFKEMPNMSFLPGVGAGEIADWEAENSVALPADYKEWLMFSDGGEIYIPGMQLYGVSHKPLLSYYNQPDEREDLPEELFVLGEFGFGDVLCFVKGESAIVQWDHELWEEYMRWESFKDFLSEAEELFGEGS